MNYRERADERREKLAQAIDAVLAELPADDRIYAIRHHVAELRGFEKRLRVANRATQGGLEDAGTVSQER